jgi:hypothetical protein
VKAAVALAVRDVRICFLRGREIKIFGKSKSPPSRGLRGKGGAPFNIGHIVIGLAFRLVVVIQL